MNIITDLKAKFNPKLIYNLQLGQIDKRIIKIAINKKLPLQNDFNLVLRGNPLFLITYFKEMDIETIKKEFDEIALSKLTKEDRQILLEILRQKDFDFFAYIINRDKYYEELDFTKFTFNDKEFIQLFPMFAINTNSIKNKTIYSTNNHVMELICKHNTKYLNIVYKDLLELYPNEHEMLLEGLMELFKTSKFIGVNQDIVKELVINSPRKNEYINILINSGNPLARELAEPDMIYDYFDKNISNINENNISVLRNVPKDKIVLLFYKYLDSDKVDSQTIKEFIYKSNFIKLPDDILEKIEGLILENKINIEDFMSYIRNNPITMLRKDFKYFGIFLKEHMFGFEDKDLIFKEFKDKLRYLTNEEWELYLRGNLHRTLFKDVMEAGILPKNLEFIDSDLLMMSVENRNLFYKYTESKNNRRIIDAYRSKENFNEFENEIHNFYFKVTDVNHEQVFDILRKLKEKNDVESVILIMERVDKNFIKECNRILPGLIRVAPLANQVNSAKIVDPLSYEVKDILEKDKTLDLYVESIMKSYDLDHNLKELSPFEKYCAAYRIVTHFAKYNLGDDKDYRESRSIYNFINNPDLRICCEGYTLLLKEILERIGGFQTYDWGVVCDVEAARNEEKNTSSISHETDRNGDNHSRLMVRITDPKYGIDGFYMADPTWDSIRKDDLGKKTSSSKHLLMSQEEAEHIDGDLFYNERCLRYYKTDRFREMDPSLTDEEIHILTNKPIDVDLKAKALIMVDNFVDISKKLPDLKDISKGEILYKEIMDRMLNRDLTNEEIDILFNYYINNFSFDDLVNNERFNYKIKIYFANKINNIFVKDNYFVENGEINFRYGFDDNNRIEIMKLINTSFKKVTFVNYDNEFTLSIRISDYYRKDSTIKEDIVKLISTINDFKNKMRIIYMKDINYEEQRMAM